MNQTANPEKKSAPHADAEATREAQLQPAEKIEEPTAENFDKYVASLYGEAAATIGQNEQMLNERELDLNA